MGARRPGFTNRQYLKWGYHEHLPWGVRERARGKSTRTRAVDVVVLGAGVVGVTTAYALVQRGFTVAIADRRAGPGLETSYANGGQLSYAYSDALASPGLLRQLDRKSTRLNSSH